jgi:hypothetical protein
VPSQWRKRIPFMPQVLTVLLTLPPLPLQVLPVSLRPPLLLRLLLLLLLLLLLPRAALAQKAESVARKDALAK